MRSTSLSTQSRRVSTPTSTGTNRCQVNIHASYLDSSCSLVMSSLVLLKVAAVQVVQLKISPKIPNNIVNKILESDTLSTLRGQYSSW